MRNDFESNYLAHHGILGQKWGKKNGPPYPLGSGDHSAREKKAGWRKSLGGGRNEELYGKNKVKKSQSANSESAEEAGTKKKGLSDKQKKALKIGAAAAATALIAYGGYKLYQSGALTNIGKSVVSDALKAGSDQVSSSEPKTQVSKIFNQEHAKAIAELTGFKMKEKAGTLTENLSVNEGKYKGGKEDPLRNNCPHAVATWILNEIGLDVKANPLPDEFIDGGMTPFEFKRFFKGTEFKTYKPSASSTVEQAEKSLKDQILNLSNGENGAGVWRIKGNGTGGHFMGWKIEDGEVTLTNPQIESDNVSKWLKIIAAGQVDGDISISNRLDNLMPNPKYIKVASRNA